MSHKYNLGEELDVTIEKIVPRGFGLAFAENLTVFVPLAAAGDQVRVRISHIKHKTAFADIVSVIVPGATRVSPLCEYFGVCGGCDFQQIAYPGQLQAKSDIIRDCSPHFSVRSTSKVSMLSQARKSSDIAPGQNGILTESNKLLVIFAATRTMW